MTATIKKIRLSTKADEINHLRDFVAALPEQSYIYSCLSPFVAEFEQDVYSDFVPNFAASWAHRCEARHEAVEAAKELKAVQDQVKAARAELADQVNRLNRVQDSLFSLRTSVEQAARIAGVVSDKSSQLLNQ